MAMKERTGRSRVSKSDEIAEKIVKEENTASVHTRVRPTSKTDEIAQKISGTSKPSGSTPTRVRPSSKADEIGKKIPTPKPAAERPVNPAPQQASSRITPPAPVSKPAEKKRSGCCLLPFTLALTVIITALIVIF